MTSPRPQTVASYFSLACAAWIPYAVTWDATTGEFRSVEGPHEFATYQEAVEASRFLVLDVNGQFT